MLYPLIEAGTSPPSTTEKGSKKKEDVIIYVRKIVVNNPDGSFKKYSYAIAKPDITFTKTPGCILCDYNNKLSKDDAMDIKDANIAKNRSHVHILQKNTELRNDWLYGPKDQIGVDAIALPSDENSTLFVKGNVGQAYFYEFVLFTQEAALQGTGSPSSGGQSDGRKTAAPSNVIIPVAGGTGIAAP